jgi:ribonucleoside-diphosphate reductase beta chain
VTEIQLNDPQTLYRRWEDSQWSPFEIDLGSDREQWGEISDADRDLVYWALSSLIVAEERITTKFSGLVGAYGSEEEATFLATQQVDEARHMQFYARFRDEVIDSPDLIAAHVRRARERISPAFRRLFDEVVVEAHESLIHSPDDPLAKVRFVTIYHLILESTLGLTAFRFITQYLERAGLLPGFVDGYSKIHHDETRHIGYGVWFLREAVREQPQAPETIRATLAELLPVAAESLSLPEGDPGEALGASTDEVRAFALSGLTRRLDIIGVPLDGTSPA